MQINFKWEQRKLGDVVNFFSGLTYHPNDVKNKGYFVIRSSNIQNNQIVSADDIFVNKDIINVPNVKQGDIIVVVRNGSRKLIGKHAQVLTDMPNTVIGAFMTGVRSKGNFYINALLDTDQFQKEIYKNLGATINQITTGEFRKMKFIITSGNEAQTIGEFFKKIDNLITLQQRKLEQLKQLKKAMLQRLFVDKDNKQPSLRFRNFNGDWEQRKLDEVAQVTMGQSPSSSNYTDNPNDYVLVQGNADLKLNKISPRVWTKEITKQVHKGEFIMTVRAPVGYLAMANMDAVIGRGVAAIDGNKFLYYLLQTKLMNRTWEKLSSGSTFESISSNDIKNLEIKITENEEEKLISKLMDKVICLITLQQNQLTQLTTLKKYLLQKLFI